MEITGTLLWFNLVERGSLRVFEGGYEKFPAACHVLIESGAIQRQRAENH